MSSENLKAKSDGIKEVALPLRNVTLPRAAPTRDQTRGYVSS